MAKDSAFFDEVGPCWTRMMNIFYLLYLEGELRVSQKEETKLNKLKNRFYLKVGCY